MTSKARQLADLGGDTANLEDISSAYSSGALSNRNFIINSAMQVAQRGTNSSGVSGTAYVACDRFYTLLNALGTYTVSQASDGPSGFASSLKYECTTADASPAAADYFVFQYRMEGQDLQQIAKGTSDAKPITLSFWVKSNVTGTYSMYLRDIDNNRGVGANYAISSSGVWEYKTVTIPADTTGVLDNDNDLSFSLEWWLGSGTDYSSGTMPTTWETENEVDRNAGSTVNVGDTIGNYFQITGVQLEAGDTATPFEHRSFGQELALCQRYFQSSFATGTAPAAGLLISMYVTGTAYSTSAGTGLGTRFPVDMRSTPTMAYYPATPASGSVGTVSVYTGGAWANRPAIPHDAVSPTMQAFDINASSAFTVGPFMCQYNYTANAEL